MTNHSIYCHFHFFCGDLFLSLIQTYIPSMTSHNTLFIQSKTCNYILSRDRNNCNILAVLYIIFTIFSSPPANIPRRLWEFNLTLPRSGRLISWCRTSSGHILQASMETSIYVLLEAVYRETKVSIGIRSAQQVTDIQSFTQNDHHNVNHRLRLRPRVK